MPCSSSWRLVERSKLKRGWADQTGVFRGVLRILENTLLNFGGQQVQMRRFLDLDISSSWSRRLGGTVILSEPQPQEDMAMWLLF